MNRKIVYSILWMLLLTVGFTSCDGDDIDESALYTFTGETVASFCRNTENLSTFYRIMEESETSSLLSVYGHYTCFIPTDSAFTNYFNEKGITYEQLTKEDKAEIVYNHVIKSLSIEYLSTDFQEGALPALNMKDRFLVISYTNVNGSQVIMVNKNSPITIKDNEVHNGVVHVVGRVIEPSTDDIASLIKQQDRFSIFSEAMELTHLGDSLLGIYDYSYVDPSPGEDYTTVLTYTVAVIHTRRLGYTLLAETDDVFREAGINSMEDLIEFSKNYYGTTDLQDYTSRNNPLNKFVSYHLLNRQMSTNAFIYQGPNTSAYAMDQRHEYYETMLKMRLIEFKAGNQINTRSNGSFVGIDEVNSNVDAMNGYIHALTNVLVYDEDVMQNDVLNKRLRIDAYSIAPELTNNNIRWQLAGTSRDALTITSDFCGENLTFNDATNLILWGNNSWDDHQADEMSFRGWYDFTFRLPPVPPGTWEIRLGYSCREWGGVTQVFIDGGIVGIPIDFYTVGTEPAIGWIDDAQTTDGGAENDKMMRNRGYMKGGNAICNSGYGSVTNRASPRDLRKIVGTFTFQDYNHHYFRARNVQSENGEFHLDYFEYVPVSYLDKETID